MQLVAQRAHLSALADAGRLRTLAPRHGVDLSSNDYLALSTAPRLVAAAQAALARGIALGSGGSRLLRGNDAEHEALEAEAAAFFGAEALSFGSGYAANTALLSSVPQSGDLIVYDALVHASMHDGMRLGRATCVAAAHGDAQAADDAIAAWRAGGGTGTPWIAIESLYSMDGDLTDVAAYLAVADRHDAMLVVDEAHATGVWGAGGRGVAEAWHGRANLVTLNTFGKALGCEGAVLCGPALIRDFLVARARPFIFSTAPSPLSAAVARESLRSVADEPERRAQLHALVAAARRHLAPLGARVESQIVPLVIGDDRETMRVASAVQNAGFDVRGIRPPTVPAGTARLRIALTLHVTEAEIAALADVLREVLP
ncbi:8-amino-7-oxononanoate synthase [Sphingomonas endophytica]|uniref:8-amino-7-oxononanoate synthase n=1 Tax=Sphingomonas endophytica TaxID=869719 RepID=A0ABR6NAT4_9SPHN|nr:8-amino-7-oxononanoate synthase [Sphingomonas endophytica]MBB5727300.1 8-amino-7-oxononanoate synthase [Sphingomonas endophytica]